MNTSDLVIIYFTKDNVKLIKENTEQLYIYDKRKMKEIYDKLNISANEDRVCFNTLHP